MKINNKINFNKDEIDDIKYIKENELINFLKNEKNKNDIYTPWFLPTLEKVIEYRLKN